jgi:CubicO group peptidase (beta-lactamase class C family)
MKKVIALVLTSFTIFFLSLHADAQIAAALIQSSKIETEAAGFSPQRLKNTDALMQSWVDKGYMNGAVALIIRDGKVAYYKAFGYDNIEKKKPFEVNTIFRIASQTKAITSVAVMMLFEEGKFLLDDKVADYIPEFANAQVLEKFNPADSSYTTRPAKRQITIRDLLTHTSGIGYAQIGSKEQTAIYAKHGVVGGIGVDRIILGDKMKILGKLPLFHDPGAQWTYGLNTDLLGYLVEVVSGMSLDEFFKKRIFQPLGMNDTHFYLPAEKYARLATLYSEDKNGKLYQTENPYELNGKFNPDFPATKGTYYSGGGGLSSTILDYGIFLQMLLNGGKYNGVRILSSNAVRMMTTNQLGDMKLWGSDDSKFGLGFGLTTENGSGKMPQQAGSFEWGGMFATTYWVDPKEKLVGLFYRNIYPTSRGDLSSKFKVQVYQAIDK